MRRDDCRAGLRASRYGRAEVLGLLVFAAYLLCHSIPVAAQAVIEATEGAVYNSMFKATTMTGNGHTVEALPIEKTVEILKEHRVIK